MTKHTPALAKVVQTCSACPSQWDAWDAEGRYYYLRYRSGIGTVDTYPDPDPDTWTTPPDGAIARFEHGDGSDGYIGLNDFLALAGLSISARVLWAPDEGDPVELNANLTIRIVPDAPDTEPQCVLLDPPARATTADGDELTFVRDENMPCELPPQTRRFLVARWPGGLTKVREVFPGEAE